jgi:hypothetical protein
MIPRANVEELARAHAALDEPTTGAIWIHRDRPEAWLVEVIPTMAADDHADEPVYLNAGAGFRFPLAIIAGNRDSLEAALRRNADLARAVADGDVVVGAAVAQPLLELARQLAA